jgi:hypothetical protein
MTYFKEKAIGIQAFFEVQRALNLFDFNESGTSFLRIEHFGLILSQIYTDFIRRFLIKTKTEAAIF